MWHIVTCIVFRKDVFVCVGLYSTDVLDCIQIVSPQRLIVFQAIHCFRQLLAFAKRPLASAQLCKNSQFVCASDPHHHITFRNSYIITTIWFCSGLRISAQLPWSDNPTLYSQGHTFHNIPDQSFLQWVNIFCVSFPSIWNQFSLGIHQKLCDQTVCGSLGLNKITHVQLISLKDHFGTLLARSFVGSFMKCSIAYISYFRNVVWSSLIGQKGPEPPLSYIIIIIIIIIM